MGRTWQTRGWSTEDICRGCSSPSTSGPIFRSRRVSLPPTVPHLQRHAKPRARLPSTPCCISQAGPPDPPSTSANPFGNFSSHSSSVETTDELTYQALTSELVSLAPEQLREAAYRRSSELLDSRFLFWLRDRERRPGLGAAEREAMSRLGQELTVMREWTEEQASRTLLPSLASSLAYSNLRRWKEETGAEAPEVVAGVDVEQLYRLGEQEEVKLRASLEAGGGGLGPRRRPNRSSIEEFTKYNKAYADLAAGAIERVQQRLMGFDDSGPSAAAAVLRALLWQMASAEERANYLPEAFTPPGMQIWPDAAIGERGGGGSAKPSFVVTTPAELMAAARERLAALSSDGPVGGNTVTEDSSLRRGSRAVDAATAAGAGPRATTGFGATNPSSGLLPSGEDETAALAELLELIEEYDQQVYSRKTPLERMGHNPGPW